MPTTRSRYTLPDMVGDPRDWSFTWEMFDDVQLASVCGFCAQDRQRLTYEVARGEDRLFVCQRCVGRYAFGGVLDGYRLDLRSAKAQIHGLTARLKQQTCQDVIKAVQAGNPDPALEEVLVYFDRNLQLSPQRAATLFTAMTLAALPVNVAIFEVQTRSIAHQDEFGTLDEAGKRAVWPALTPLQKRRLVSLGHAPAGIPSRKPRQKARALGE